MNRFIILALIVICAFSCSSKKANPNSEANNSIINNSGPANDSNATGASLIAANDCFTCHSITKKTIGPAFIQIAQKYPDGTGVAENLAHSIISGSIGIWGTASSMVPHPNVSYPDAVKMAAYILSLREQMHQDSLRR